MASKERMEELRKMFGGAAAPTPENQKKRIKQGNEDMKNAVKVARARAARYNMTLRSLALKAMQDQKKRNLDERAKVEAAKAEAAKYNATKRALQMQNGRPTRKMDIDTLNQTLSEDVTPLIAQEVMEVIAINEMSVEEILQAPEQGEEDEDTQKGEEDNEEAFEMSNLQEAFNEGDEEGFNRAILKDFLETHAPEELPNLDAKLKEYEGKEQLLFDYYTEKYPNTMDAAKEGTIRAEEEVLGGSEGALEQVESNFVKTSDPAEEKRIEEERNRAYQSTIEKAEDSEEGRAKVMASAAKRKERDSNLINRSKAYEEVDTSGAEGSLGVGNGGYILGAKIEKKKNDESDNKWVVQMKPVTELGDKLEQLGLEQKRANAIKDAVQKTVEGEENEAISGMM